jgi:hypothetical protein
MAIPASFDSATGALTGDNLDHTIATSHDAARPKPSLRDDPDSGGQIQSAVPRPAPSLRSDPDSGGQIQSAMQRPMPSLWDDPDAGGQIQSVVQQFAGGQHTSTASDMAGASDQLLMLGATSRLVQATASFSAAGAADTSTTLPLGGETSQPSFLTTPQHP